MILTALAAVAIAAIAAASVRSAPPVARLAALLLVLLFGVVLAAPDEVAFTNVDASAARVELRSGDAAAVANATLTAAASAGPRAVDLEVGWRTELAADAVAGSLGARAVLPEEPLPIDPHRVQVTALGAAVVDRPVVLAASVPGLDDTTAAELVVRSIAGGTRTEVLRQSLALDRRRAAECSLVPRTAGPHEVELSFVLRGHRLEGRGTFDVAAAPRVLVVEPSGVAAAALRAQGVVVDEQNTLPADWRDRAALVLGRPLPAAEQQALVAAVIDGFGVFVVAPAFGGPDAPIRALLPVRPLPDENVGNEGVGGGAPRPAPPASDPPSEPPPDRPPDGETSGATRVDPRPIEVDKRAIAMVLVVDRSGSMGTEVVPGRTKMSYAKTSALRTARALGPGDATAIVTFGNKGAGRVELPLTDAADLAKVRAGIERLAQAQEMTFLLSGLRTANDVLANSTAAVKHVVVITDGEFDLGESVALHAVARHMREEGKITVSVISIVDANTDQSFKREAELLTRAGGGQFLPIDDPTVVPVLVSAEVTRALSRVGREPRPEEDGGTNLPAPPPPQPRPDEPPDRPRERDPAPRLRVVVRAVAASPLLAPIPDGAWPTLGAATPGKAPLDALVLLVAGENGWPLLAFGNRGLGRVGAFAADLFGPAADEFRGSAGFSARLAQWVQHVVPPLPVRAPRDVLQTIVVEPPVPSARDVALLERLGGDAPVVAGALAPAAPRVVRVRAATAPDRSWWLVVGVVVLALLERWSAAWALRRDVAR